MRVTLLIILALPACEAPLRRVAVPAGLPEDVTSLRLRRHGHELVRVGDGLYSIGGYGDAFDRGRKVLRFRLPRGPWEVMGTTPVPMSFFGAVVVGTDVFCIADGVHRFRPTDGTWRSWSGEGRLPRSHHGAAYYRGRIYVLGGIPEGASRMWAVDPRNGSFKEAVPPPGFEPTDHLHVMVVAGGRLHVVGGTTASGSGLARRHASFDGERWHSHPDPPAALWRKFEAVGAVLGRIVIGGRDGTHIFDTSTGAWSRHDAMPAWVVMPACFVEDGRLFALGGRAVARPQGTPSAYAAFAFDPIDGTWSGDVK